MRQKNIFIHIIVFATVVFFCAPNNSGPSYSFNSHNIQLFLSPATNTLTAIDSVGITFKKSSNKIYFLLHDSLTIEKVEIGHQIFSHYKAKKSNTFKKDFGAIEYKDIQIYEINLPYNLSPNSIKIYFTGYIWIMDESIKLPPDYNFLLTDKRIVLEKDSCWYPSIPGSEFKFNLSTLSPSFLNLYCTGQQSSKTFDGDYIYYNWVQPEPVDGITLVSKDS